MIVPMPMAMTVTVTVTMAVSMPVTLRLGNGLAHIRQIAGRCRPRHHACKAHQQHKGDRQGYTLPGGPWDGGSAREGGIETCQG